MYVSTFYSFKGGVGRSLALVNVACELARRGRKVLLVDLDLEAPGLETFPALQCPEGRPGLVDFIHDYLQSGRSPNVVDYVSQCGSTWGGGTLWLMSAGHSGNRYGDLFSSIDWQALYDQHDGYLLFEDLKQQWKQELDPDYVLIDSRTGHTDVGGICTRQLPDSVVLFFFPNAQNIRGLAKVAEDIRAEGASGRNISMKYVLANAPDLDDELGILREQLNQAREAIGYPELSATIHHYDSMALLAQEAFVVSRPNTKLAQEYRALTDTLISDNIHDRDGVRVYLDKLTDSLFTEMVERQVDASSVQGSPVPERVEDIVELYRNNADILSRAALIYDLRHEYSACLSLLLQVLALEGDRPPILMRVAMLTRLTEGVGAATPFLERLFRHPNATHAQMRQAIAWVRDTSPSSLALLLGSPVFEQLATEQRAVLLDEMLWDGCEVYFERAYNKLRDRPLENMNASVRHSLVLAAVALRRFSDAIELLRLGSSSISDVFNCAIADWGIHGVPDSDLFAGVIALHESSPPRHTANYWMCIGIACRALGDIPSAKSALKTSYDMMKAGQVPEFSAWRYRLVSPADFLADIEEIVFNLETDVFVPPIVRGAKA